jgi:hypothetical protein
MKRIPTSLISKATSEPVTAYLVEAINRDLLVNTELAWATLRIEGAKRIHADGGDVPQHWHWNWSNKSSKIDLLAYRCFGIECDNEMQGLMLVNTTNFASRMESQRGKPMVYVDYIEAAPWNVKELTAEPRYGGVGIRLIEAAIRYSLTEKFGGRIGLHSLPQSEHFYEKTCGMTRGEIDQRVEGLRWFELTAANAKKFLGDDIS